MGIKGVWKALLPKASPSALQPSMTNQKYAFDHLLIDLNPLLHRFAPFNSSNDVLKSNLDLYLKYLFGKIIHPVRACLNNFTRPNPYLFIEKTKSVYLCLDGPSSMSKLVEQRSRRLKWAHASSPSKLNVR
jgi:5'-3' exonuclease